MDSKLAAWWNYRTEEYEYIPTPSDFSDYIPQSQIAQGLYSAYQELGIEPIEAAQKVLEIVTGSK